MPYSKNHPIWGDKKRGQQIVDAINLLEGDYVWSADFNKLKPLLIQILKRNDATSTVLASILEREC
jgi:hypothetical protein